MSGACKVTRIVNRRGKGAYNAVRDRMCELRRAEGQLCLRDAKSLHSHIRNKVVIKSCRRGVRKDEDTDRGEGWRQLEDNTVRRCLRSRSRYRPGSFETQDTLTSHASAYMMVLRQYTYNIAATTIGSSASRSWVTPTGSTSTATISPPRRVARYTRR